MKLVAGEDNESPDLNIVLTGMPYSGGGSQISSVPVLQVVAVTVIRMSPGLIATRLECGSMSYYVLLAL